MFYAKYEGGAFANFGNSSGTEKACCAKKKCKKKEKEKEKNSNHWGLAQCHIFQDWYHNFISFFLEIVFINPKSCLGVLVLS